uniref:Uncharacterized protein n=1 Tax=Sphaeramia orbicularis TaxID=375764 RepID=A0A672Z9P0_9TELE
AIQHTLAVCLDVETERTGLRSGTSSKPVLKLPHWKRVWVAFGSSSFQNGLEIYDMERLTFSLRLTADKCKEYWGKWNVSVNQRNP